MDFEKMDQALSAVLSFSSKITMSKLTGEMIALEEFEAAKEYCRFLNTQGVYTFNTECSDEDFAKELEQFAQWGIENS